MATDVRVDEIHPDLRRVARFAPRQIVYPWSLPLLRRLPVANRSSDDGVDVVDLPSGAGARLYRPTAAAAPTAQADLGDGEELADNDDLALGVLLLVLRAAGLIDAEVSRLAPPREGCELLGQVADAHLQCATGVAQILEAGELANAEATHAHIGREDRGQRIRF